MTGTLTSANALRLLGVVVVYLVVAMKVGYLLTLFLMGVLPFLLLAAMVAASGIYSSFAAALRTRRAAR